MAEADQALLALAQKLKLTEAGKPLLPTASSMRIGNNSCLRANLETGEIKAYGSGECTNSAQEYYPVQLRWWRKSEMEQGDSRSR